MAGGRNNFQDDMVQRLLIGFTLAIVLAACSQRNTPTPVQNSVTPAPIRLDRRPEVIILYVDARYRGGAPEPTVEGVCHKEFVPLLRLYGDGYAFLNRPANEKLSNMFVGILSEEEVNEVIIYLWDKGFFDNSIDLSPVNPAGTGLIMRATLANVVAEYWIGDVESQLFIDIADKIRPHLQSLSQQAILDPRVESLLEEEFCDT
jgi:hypothetical protein